MKCGVSGPCRGPASPAPTRGKATAPPDHRGASTWFTGSYDPDLDLVYWPVGNPKPGIQRRRSAGRQPLRQLPSSRSTRANGRLKWYYQFTPHDLWDWDATQTSVLVDADWQGRPRKLLLHANRNGFFYVFDRADGTLLLAKPFVTQPDVGERHRHRRQADPAAEPGADGRRHEGLPVAGRRHQLVLAVIQPADGALLHPDVREVQHLHEERWRRLGSRANRISAARRRPRRIPMPQRVLKAIDIQTGAIKWDVPQPGPATSWGGTLATATGLVFVGEESGSLMAVDAVTGTRLWSFAANAGWKASPMTYAFDGRQYIAVAAGSAIIAFRLP